MSARNQVGWLLKQGYSPGEIAIKRKVSEDVTRRSLFQLVGEGRLRRSDIYYSIPKEIRNLIALLFEERSKRHPDNRKLYRSLAQTIRRKYKSAKKLDIELAIVYWSSRIEMGDLYEDVRNLELHLNKLVKDTLIEIHNDGEDKWWYKGVPERIRVECVTRRERDNISRTDNWNYIDLIHLKEILDGDWGKFMVKLWKDVKHNKPSFISNLVRLNSIRNSVMHPSRNDILSEEDFEFIRNLKETLIPTKKNQFYEPSFIGTESERFNEIQTLLNQDSSEDEGLHLVT